MTDLADAVERLDPTGMSAAVPPAGGAPESRPQPDSGLAGRLRRYERALDAARDRVAAALDLRQSLIDSLPAAVALLDREGRIIHVTPSGGGSRT